MAKKSDSPIDAVINELNAELGAATLQKLDSMEKVDVDAIPTGSLALDWALGIGGIPKGRVVEIYGPESGGKTTLTLAIAGMAQRKDPKAYVVLIDAEHAMDPVYATAVGVDMNRTIINQPDNGEQAFQLIEKLVTHPSPPAVIVVDSVAALVPKAELEYEMNSDKNNQPGRQAAMLSLGLRKVTAMIAKSACTVIFINQLREKIGIMFGSPETTPGGKALKFYASVRIDIRRVATVEGPGKEAIGNRVKTKIVKNKVAAPFKICEFIILFGKGIDELTDLTEMGEKVGVIEKVKEGHYKFGETTWSSKAGLAELWQDPLFQDSLRTEVKKKVFEPVGE